MRVCSAGPGDAITPRQQGEFLFALLRRPPLFRSVPLALLDGIVGALGMAARVAPHIAEKAELARTGRYYAIESMLWLNPETGHYDSAGTPSTGTETLFDFYRSVIAGDQTPSGEITPFSERANSGKNVRFWRIAARLIVLFSELVTTRLRSRLLSFAQERRLRFPIARECATVHLRLPEIAGENGTATPARTGDPQIHNLVL